MTRRHLYFYGSRSHRRGPVTAEWLQTLLGRGMIGPATRVWSEGMPEWVPASSLPFLQPVLRGELPVDHSFGPGALEKGPWSKWALAAAACCAVALVSVVVNRFVAVPVLVGQIGLVAIPCGVVGCADIRRHPQKRGMWLAVVGTAVVLALTVSATVYDFIK